MSDRHELHNLQPVADPMADAYDDSAIGRLWSARSAAEAELLGAVLADPARGYPDGRAAGVDGNLIADDLCRVVWLAAAAKAMGHRFALVPAADRNAVCVLARSYLAAEREWSNDHDAPRLADLAFAFPFYLPSAVTSAAGRLLGLAATLDELSLMFDRYRVLTGPWAEGVA